MAFTVTECVVCQMSTRSFTVDLLLIDAARPHSMTDYGIYSLGCGAGDLQSIPERYRLIIAQCGACTELVRIALACDNYQAPLQRMRATFFTSGGGYGGGAGGGGNNRLQAKCHQTA